MINEMRGMGGGASEVPPGYAEALESNNRLIPERQSEVIAKLAELNNKTLEAKKAALMEIAAKMLKDGDGKLPSEVPTVSDIDKKMNFVLAVEYVSEKIKKERYAEEKRNLKEYSARDEFRQI